ncbi:MAG: heme-binding protein [Deltaproteobacteria bacterium]|nr:heme-binding protein [Deltaproteobacteria bacterium]
MAIEEPTYQVVERRPDYELRAYGPYVVAEVEVKGTQESAGNAGFRVLAAYIFGENRSRESIAMTAPVTTARSQKIAMTAPVIERAAGEGTYLVQFTMPAGYTLASLPEPKDRRVQLREVAARSVAVRRYSGGWSQSRYQAELQTLERALRRDALAFVGEPLWARFNSPFSLPFLRRNEIWLELATAR